jgi:hypothetical protein
VGPGGGGEWEALRASTAGSRQKQLGGSVDARVGGAQTLADRGIDQDADEDGAGSGYVSGTWRCILDQPAPRRTRIHASHRARSELSLHRLERAERAMQVVWTGRRDWAAAEGVGDAAAAAAAQQQQ